jgi:nucleotide-binding universal stress UspA family protein
MIFKKILCPLDFSACSKNAMNVAVRLAVESHAELVLVHAWHLQALAFAGETPIPSDAVDAMARDAERELAKAKAEATKLGADRVTTQILMGAPWDQIVELARKEAVDLVVMGTHGRTGLKHVLLGSVAEKVVRHAPCSVLVVR